MDGAMVLVQWALMCFASLMVSLASFKYLVRREEIKIVVEKKQT